MTKRRDTKTDPAREAKAIVALALRNGPLEDLHAGARCANKPGVSKISDAEMNLITKNAVNRVHALLRLKENDVAAYAREIAYGARCATAWDDPEIAGPPSLRSTPSGFRIYCPPVIS